MIYHITSQAAWNDAQYSGFYEAASLATEGFIHNSSREQLPAVQQRYYKDATGMIILHIEEDRLTSPLKYELAPSINEMFPHIYGPINIDAVVNTEPL
jgi:uncharacterized protein (DUF952 family)